MLGFVTRGIDRLLVGSVRKRYPIIPLKWRSSCEALLAERHGRRKLVLVFNGAGSRMYYGLAADQIADLKAILDDAATRLDRKEVTEA